LLVVSSSVVLAALALTPIWTTNNQEANFIFYGRAVAVAGDVNGDGFGDVLVGAHGYPSPTQTIGRAYLYYGNAGGASTTAAWIDTGFDAADTFGEAVAGAGDVNGDGFADIIVGAQNAGQFNGGRAFVYHGSASGPSLAADWLNADTETDSTQFGESVAGAGDVNGDGYDDVVIGATSSGQLGGGRADLYLGSAAGLSLSANWTTPAVPDFSDLGESVAGGGDVNGDGYDDIIVGAPGYPGADGFPAGAAFLFLGSAAGPSATPDWTALAPPDNPHAAFPQGDLFGQTVAIPGDLNGDGYDDVVVGQDFSGMLPHQGEGKVYIYYGSPSGPATTASKEIEGNKQNAFFSQSLSGADVNDDGFADLIVGAPGYASPSSQTREGALFVFYGSANGPGTKKVTRIEGNQQGAVFAAALGAGDVNGDGFADVVVGAPTDATLPPSSERAFLFLGAAGLPN
jgi:hypothetical protein